MKLDIELKLREMGIPVARQSIMIKTQKVMTLSSGFVISENNSFYIKQAIVQLATNRGLRGAHVFLKGRTQFQWNIFFVKDEPLTQAEVNGHMIFTIEYMKHPELSRLQSVRRTEKKLIFDTDSVIEYLEEIEESVPIFVILVFDNLIYTTGNFISETMLCKAILNYKISDYPQPTKGTWPESDGRSRLLWYAKHRKRIFDRASFLVSSRESVIRNVK